MLADMLEQNGISDNRSSAGMAGTRPVTRLSVAAASKQAGSSATTAVLGKEAAGGKPAKPGRQIVLHIA